MIASVIGRIGEVFDIGLWAQWFAELDRTFVFLLLLPFVVAVVGLWAAWRDREIGQELSPPQGHGGHARDDRRGWREPVLPE